MLPAYRFDPCIHRRVRDKYQTVHFDGNPSVPRPSVFATTVNTSSVSRSSPTARRGATWCYGAISRFRSPPPGHPGTSPAALDHPGRDWRLPAVHLLRQSWNNATGRRRDAAVHPRSATAGPASRRVQRALRRDRRPPSAPIGSFNTHSVCPTGDWNATPLGRR